MNLLDRWAAPNIISWRKCRPRRRRDRPIQREHPTLVMRLERDRLPDSTGGRRALIFSRQSSRRVRGAPFKSVAAVQNHAAPVQSGRRRDVSIRKFNPERNRRRMCQRCHAACGKPAREARTGALTLSQLESEPHANPREQQEKEKDQRHRLQDKLDCAAHWKPKSAAPTAMNLN